MKNFSGNNALLYSLALFVVLVVMATTSSCGSCSTPEGNPRTGNIDDFITSLENDNIVVQDGKALYVDTLKLCSQGLIKTCYGNNAGSSYFMLQVPPAPGQAPSPGQAPPDGYDPNATDNYPANIGLYPPGMTFKLRSDEALVFVGKTPPKCKYFGFTSYIFATENKPGKEYSTATEGDDTVGYYHAIFGSLGDTLNPLNIRTVKTPLGRGNDPFYSTTVIIITADRGTDGRIRSALAQAGYSDSIVNNAVIPSGLVKMGLEKGKDMFLYLIRVAQWEDEGGDAEGNYINYLDKDARVFRLTPTSTANPDPYPVPALRPRGSGQSEYKTMADLSTDIDTLREGILEKYAAPDYTYTEPDTSTAVPEGFTGYTSDVFALGDNRDTTYLKINPFKLNSDDDFIIVYGLNHDTSGKSIYCNASFYGVKYLNGVASVYSKDFPGSADEFFPQGYANAKNYYVYKMVRENSSPAENCANCVTIPKSTGNPEGMAYGVDNGQAALIAFRAYLETETGIGPSYYEILYDRAIIFHKKESDGE